MCNFYLVIFHHWLYWKQFDILRISTKPLLTVQISFHSLNKFTNNTMRLCEFLIFSLVSKKKKKRKDKHSVLAECKVLTDKMFSRVWRTRAGGRSLQSLWSTERGKHFQKTVFCSLSKECNFVLLKKATSGSAKVKTFVSLQLKGNSKGTSAVCISLA